MVLRIIIVISIFVFFTSSIVSAYLTRMCSINSDSKALYQITLVRVSINDFLFVIFGFVLGTYLYKLAKLSSNYVIPEQNNISVIKAILVTIGTSAVLVLRTVYNLLAINAVSLKLPDFNFDWINVSDQADLVSLTETNKFISFFCVLLIWELIPTFVIISLFRLKRNDRTINISVNASASFAKKSVFLDS